MHFLYRGGLRTVSRRLAALQTCGRIKGPIGLNVDASNGFLLHKSCRFASSRSDRENMTKAPKAVAGDKNTTVDIVGSGLEFLQGHLKWNSRTHFCGQIRESDVADTVTICGWVDRHRDLGGLIFLDIRDHTGMVQVVVDDEASEHIANLAERVRNEWVVSISGVIRRRKDPNPNMATGQVELVIQDIQVLNLVTKSLPFPLSEHEESEAPREEIRLKNRVLDLRCVRKFGIACSTILALVPLFLLLILLVSPVLYADGLQLQRTCVLGTKFPRA